MVEIDCSGQEKGAIGSRTEVLRPGSSLVEMRSRSAPLSKLHTVRRSRAVPLSIARLQNQLCASSKSDALHPAALPSSPAPIGYPIPICYSDSIMVESSASVVGVLLHSQVRE
jgi:hypothetical protein